MAPSLALQQLTTREPELAMLAVSIAALQQVLRSEGLAAEPVDGPCGRRGSDAAD